MLNYYFKDSIGSFIQKSPNEIIGEINSNNYFDSISTQKKSWESQIPILKEALLQFNGTIFFEFSIPRMGKRVDVLLIIEGIVFVIEFKVGESKYQNYAVEQVWDYALDLKNFHKPSHEVPIAPILIATEAINSFLSSPIEKYEDNTVFPLKINKAQLKEAINQVLVFFKKEEIIDGEAFSKGSYSPTPTIIEAAISLYNNHSVDEITRNDSGAKNLTTTTSTISEIIKLAKSEKKKIICFVTGVPGAGKTLVGLKVATSQLEKAIGSKSVYLSGNGPLVSILQEALSRDKVLNEKNKGNKLSLKKARSSVKTFIQIIHHYRDAYLTDTNAPYDHVAIFDEAQRAWNKDQTVKFMKQRKGIETFEYSEPEFLISCLDRHQDWAVIICLVGGGQEINTGEAGISEWLNAIRTKFPSWISYISPNLSSKEYEATKAIEVLKEKSQVRLKTELHLATSMRSFRAEKLSEFIYHLLNRDISGAQRLHNTISRKYPIVLTRDLSKAKDWLKKKARGSERYGLVVSSQAYRLKPLAIDVRSPMQPVNWFLNGKDDVRSSYYLEDVATEFHIQGLELDWVCLIWDGDLRYSKDGWETHSFKGSKWQKIHKEERKRYLINAYRVLLTRARQGMIIVVPEGNLIDHTRKPEYYDPTFKYLETVGVELLNE